MAMAGLCGEAAYDASGCETENWCRRSDQPSRETDWKMEAIASKTWSKPDAPELGLVGV
jgi:hypothetical protein